MAASATTLIAAAGAADFSSVEVVWNKGCIIQCICQGGIYVAVAAAAPNNQIGVFLKQGCKINLSLMLQAGDKVWVTPAETISALGNLAVALA